MTGIGIECIATALPAQVVTNADLNQIHPGWDMDRLAARTGVYRRTIAVVGETALDLAERACDVLAAEGRLDAASIDALIFCTETPDHPLPPNSTLLHKRLKLGHAVMAFDITLACSGFVYGMGIARSLIQSRAAKRVLLATGDTYSHLIHPSDRSLRVLFGDGAAVTIIGRNPVEGEILDISFATSGAEADRFIVPAGGARLPHSAATGLAITDHSGNIRTADHIYMDGLGVLSFFSAVVPKAIEALLARNSLTKDNVDCFILHQASQLAIDGVIRGLGVDRARFVVEIADLGNLVSASIPIALDRARKSGRFKSGQIAVLCGFGVGLSWATALVRM